MVKKVSQVVHVRTADNYNTMCNIRQNYINLHFELYLSRNSNKIVKITGYVFTSFYPSVTGWQNSQEDILWTTTRGGV